MQVLVMLADHSGTVVSKQQLIESVWQNRAVGDEVITRSISLLRSCFGDNPKSPKYIETLPKLGYRLIAESRSDELAPTSEVIEKKRPPLVGIGFGVVAALLLATFFWTQDRNRETNSHVVDSVAVMPFVNMSGPEHQYLGEGISEQIISTLGAIPNVDVAARTSSFRFRNSEMDVREIAAQLGVSAIVEGSVRRSGETLRVSAQMVDALTGYQLWSDSFDGNIEEAFDLQERVSTALAREITGDTPNVVRPTSPPEPNSFAAYDTYLRAQYAFNRRTKSDLGRAAELYKQSITLDQNYAPSYRGLAYSYLLLPSYSNEDASIYYDRALATVDKASALNPEFEQMGASVRGFIHFKRGQWTEAQRAFELSVNGAYVEPTTYQWYSQMLASVGQLERSLQMAQLGRAADPLSPVANSRLAIAHLWLDQNEKARQFFDIANSLGLTTSVHLEAYTLLLLRERRFDEARVLVEKIQQAQGTPHAGFEQAMNALRNPNARETAVEQVRIAMEKRQITPRVGLLLWALLDAPDLAASAALELVVEGDLFEYELLFISELDDVRASENFEQVVEKLNLLPYWQSAGCKWQAAVLSCTPPKQP